ncbi:unnamed protein product [Vicia faba]|uniref:Uncharacterized protein n=1 Tax=Vicia faba TaxID=3906 RepID=A0AAV0ZDJ2_VICFA|nr:unnamed protein product [Vicia faba]
MSSALVPRSSSKQGKAAFPNGTNVVAPSVHSSHDFALVVRGLPNRTKMDRAVGSEKVSGTGMFGHESNSTSRPRSEDVVNLDYGKDKEVHRDWLKAKPGAIGEEGFRKLESGSER